MQSQQDGDHLPIDTRGPFYSGLFISLFAGPFIGTIPLCCANPQNVTYRGYYFRGMSVGTAIAIAVILAVIIGIFESCKAAFASFYAANNIASSEYVSSCTYIYLIPGFVVTGIWAIFGLIFYFRSRKLLSGLPQSDFAVPETDGNGPFLTGFFLSLFAGPIVGAIPLCFANPLNLKYRSWYLKGMSGAVFILGILVVVVGVLKVQGCARLNALLASYWDQSSSSVGATYYINCNSIYYVVIPIALICEVVAVVLYFRHKKLLAEIPPKSHEQLEKVVVVEKNSLSTNTVFDNQGDKFQQSPPLPVS
ncbi:UNVERIFIED_CONTAM: hypothetical protein HDU68_004648 [Siphonaria sp. JEL0065]|nr:hypothetical protein HDU68_004648 [Siphonaria sp. JEL0065]